MRLISCFRNYSMAFWQPAFVVRLMAFLVIDCLLLVLFNNVFGNSVAISGKCVSYISNEVALAWWYVSWNVGTFKQFGSHLGESDIWNFVLDGMFKILLAGKREIDWWFLLRSRILAPRWWNQMPCSGGLYLLDIELLWESSNPISLSGCLMKKKWLLRERETGYQRWRGDQIEESLGL